MTWFKVDDSFYDHPKVFDAPDCALALWTRAGCWSARNLTDGFVPAGLPARLCDDPDTAVRALVDRGLWKRTRGGYQYHDWADYQPSAASVRDLRAKRAQAGRKGGQAKAAKVTKVNTGSQIDNRYRSVTSEGCETEHESEIDAGRITPDHTDEARQPPSKPPASASAVAKQNATPTRPDPSRRDGSSVGKSSKGRNARAREDDDLDQKIDNRIIELLAELTGRQVDHEHAAKVRHQILTGRHVDNPLAYIAAAIRSAPHGHLPTTGTTHPPVAEARRAAGATGPGTDPNTDFRQARERLGGRT